MKKIIISAIIAGLTLTGLPAFAQRNFPGEAGGPSSQEQRDEIRKKIEAIRIWRMTEDLKLDSEASLKLASLLSPIEQKRREIMRERVEAMKHLRNALEAQNPSEAKIKPVLDKLESNYRAMQDLRDAEIKGLKEILTVEQQARYLMFQREFEQEMRETIAQARGGQRRGGPGLDARGPDRRDFRGPGGPGPGPEGPDALR